MQFPLIIKKIPPKGNHIFIKGKIQGVSLDFLIDTGASKSVIDKKFAEDNFKPLKIKKTEHQTTGLGANIPNSEFVTLRRVKIGDHRISPVEFALLDLEMVNSAYTAAGLDPVEAIIGGDILKRYCFVIDYGKGIVHLAE